jgi:hypothetical protein
MITTIRGVIAAILGKDYGDEKKNYGDYDIDYSDYL